MLVHRVRGDRSAGGLARSWQSRTELKRGWPPEWGEDTVSVPFVVLLELANRWLEYKDAPTGKSLGEAMGLEGVGQGAAPVKYIVKTGNRRRAIANAVSKEYLAHKGNPISKQRACEIVAEREGISFDSAAEAYGKYGKAIEARLARHGIIDSD
jgi:hypothetical protein